MITIVRVWFSNHPGWKHSALFSFYFLLTSSSRGFCVLWWVGSGIISVSRTLGLYQCPGHEVKFFSFHSLTWKWRIDALQTLCSRTFTPRGATVDKQAVVYFSNAAPPSTLYKARPQHDRCELLTVTSVHCHAWSSSICFGTNGCFSEQFLWARLCGSDLKRKIAALAVLAQSPSACKIRARSVLRCRCLRMGARSLGFFCPLHPADRALSIDALNFFGRWNALSV